MSGNGVYQNEPRPRPRLCHLHRRPDFDGYGFNLHCDRNKPGQFIGKVDANSPAESAGLQENDRIIEVNFVPVGNENHKQVVTRIKEGVSRNGTKHPEEVILLVVDQETDDFYRSKGRIPKSSDSNIDKFETDMRDYSDNGSSSSQSSNRSIGDGSVSHKESAQINRQYSSPIENNHHSPVISRTSDQDSETDDDDDDNHSSTPPPTHSNQQASKPTYTNINSSNKSPPRQQERAHASNRAEDTLNFQMSAAEYRQQLSRNSRRHDPRLNQQMTMKQKYDVVNNL